MKYFTFFTDITYNRLSLWSGGSGLSNILPPHARADGYEVTWSFMFMAHYGFFPDSEVPTGRVNPYIAVGPAIVWSNLDFGSLGVGSSGSTNVALVVEPGIRFMCLKNVSLDAAFRWRYCKPNYDFAGNNVEIDPLNQFSFLVRANYHF
jgi:opacity protein-like surface antigen